MHVSRRTFLVLSAAFAAGCAAPGGGNFSGGKKERVVNAGSASQYLANGVCSRYRDLGFFIVRRGAHLVALSAICTHRNCWLDAEADKTFYCPCHGSTFDVDGKVTEGPARLDLPVFEISTDENGDLLVKISGAQINCFSAAAFLADRGNGIDHAATAAHSVVSLVYAASWPALAMFTTGSPSHDVASPSI